MDSLKTLMDKKSYDLVIKLTENSSDALSLFYRISALLAVGQSEDALQVILTKRNILKSRLVLLIKFHLEILCLLKRFDEAYKELEYYESLPYDSQEVEEILRAMPNYIREEERRSVPRTLNEEDIQKLLLSKDYYDLLAALEALRKLSIEPFLLSILRILRSCPFVMIRCYALILLQSKKYDKTVAFLTYENELINVVPGSLKDPCNIKGVTHIDEVNLKLQNFYHDPTLANYAFQSMMTYALFIYPKDFPYSLDETIVIFGYLCKKMLKIDVSDLDVVCQDLELDSGYINKQILIVEEFLKNN